MMSFSLSGGVEVFGFISPSEPTDTYPVIDPIYGIDGLRNVNTISDLDDIPELRRRAGMVVGVSGGTAYYKLNSSPWDFNFSDWSVFNSGGGGASGDYLPLSGGTVTGPTIFTQGLTANTISATTYQNLPINNDRYVTGFTYNNNTFTISDNSGSTFNSTFNTVTGLTVNGILSATTYENLPITGITSVGSGLTIFDGIVDRTIQINTITGDTLGKIVATTTNNTIQVGINEENLDLWPLVVQGNRLLSGGVSYVSGLTFNVSPVQYIIDGSIYNISTSTTVILNSGDTLYDRVDVIVADISGNTSVVQGIPSANPEKPDIDESTEVEVTFVIVRANSVTADIDGFVIYNENLGSPAEWNFGVGGTQSSRIIGSSTGDTYSGTTSIRVSGVTALNYNTYFRLTGSTEVDTNNYATLQFALKNLSANTTTNRIRIRFLTTGGTQNGSVVYMNAAGSSGYVQYSSTNTSTWQLISIPLWKFYLTNTNVQVVEIAFSPLNGGVTSNYYFDLIEFIEGAASSPPSNSWTTIKGDSATTITAPNPNATLTISGGTNIGSVISGSSTVVLNLDDNINLNGITANTISATTYQNLPINNDRYVTGFTYNNNTFTISDNSGNTFNSTINSVTGLTVNGNLSVTGNTSVKGVTGTTALFSGSGQNIVTIIGSGSTSPLLTVQGSNGQLFTVTDDLTGELFTVSNIFSDPILRVYDDSTILIGDYLSPSLNTTKRVTAGLGSTTIYSIPISAYTGAFFDYTVSDGTNLRSGNIMSIFNTSTIKYSETFTTDIGNTSGVTFNMVISGGTSAVLQTSGTTSGWIVSTIIRSI